MGFFAHQASPGDRDGNSQDPFETTLTDDNNEEDQDITAKKLTRTSPQETLSAIQTSLEDDQAEDIVTVELSGKTSIADYMVIASGQSTRQVGAMADHIFRKLKKAGATGLTAEGQTNSDWVLIDAGDVIVHLFRPEVRAFYNLEKLWSHAGPEGMDGPADVTVRIA